MTSRFTTRWVVFPVLAVFALLLVARGQFINMLSDTNGIVRVPTNFHYFQKTEALFFTTSSVPNLGFAGVVSNQGTLTLTGTVAASSISGIISTSNLPIIVSPLTSSVPNLGFSAEVNRTILTGLVASASISGDIILSNQTSGDYVAKVFGVFGDLVSVQTQTTGYDLLYGTNVWRQVITGTTTSGGIEMPFMNWMSSPLSISNTAATFYDLAFGGATWRTRITNEVLVEGILMPVVDVSKL